MSYKIITDATSDLPLALAQQWGVEVLPMDYTLDGQPHTYAPGNSDLPLPEIFNAMRNGAVAVTSQINAFSFTKAFEPYLQQGLDIIYIGFSSALSGTVASAGIAKGELLEKYPDRKIYTVDTLCASLGQGLLVYLAAQEQRKGKSIEEVRDWAESTKLNLCHQFTVDDLHFLKRGGRISATTAVVGSMLQIKPVLHVDNEGHLISIGKARGRQASLKALVDKMEKTVTEEGKKTVFISHGDCRKDAVAVADMVRERFGTQDIRINYVGPVIGAHSGPGTLALFYLGTER